MSTIASIRRVLFWADDIFHGGVLWKAYKEIRFINKYLDKGEEIVQQKLNDIISFAKANTTFYAKVQGNELKDFPVIDKRTILADKAAFLVKPELIPGQKGELFIKSTSGSTGTPFSFPQDTVCRTRLIAMIKYGNDQIGFHSFDRLLQVRSMSHYYKGKKDYTFDRKHNILYVDNADLDEEKALAICKVINDNRIKFIRGYFTSMDIISQSAVKHNVVFKEGLTFISGGERFTETFLHRVTEQLHCRVISQYANEENGIMAQTPINGVGTNMNLNRGNCFIEILKFDKDEPAEKGELGRIVVTDLTNRAMPMIRYEVGDVASPDEIRNGVLISISNFAGRKTDLIVTTNGESVDFFNKMSSEIFLNEDILQYQFIQKGAKTYVLKLIVKDESIKNSEARFISLVKDVVGEDANVSIEYADEIPIMNSGKRKIVINEWTV